MSKNKKILDMTCGGQLIWYQPHNEQTDITDFAQKDGYIVIALNNIIYLSEE